jgi:hypothetical protein
MANLREIGFVVVPLLTEEATNHIRGQIQLEVLEQAPEMNQGTPLETPRVLGAFGAHGLASTFHHPKIRRLRGTILPVAARIVGDNFPGEQMELLPDRLCTRYEGQAPQKEGWHQDIPPGIGGGFVLGGFLNLSDRGMVFICVPRSHFTPMPEGVTGFSKLNEEQCAFCEANQVAVQVPPGHYISFYSNIWHCVAPTKAGPHYMKLFTGIHVTLGTRSLYENFQGYDHQKAIQHQGPIQLGSGQRPPMFSTNHSSAFQTSPFSAGKLPDGTPNIVQGGLVGWSTNFIPEYPRRPTTKGDRVIERYCPTLLDLGIPFEPYTASDFEIAAGGPRNYWPDVLMYNQHAVVVTNTVSLSSAENSAERSPKRNKQEIIDVHDSDA